MSRRRDNSDIRRQRSTARYQRMHASFLRANPLCAECERKGIVRAADELDHVTPAHVDPSLFWNGDNLQGLCSDCHLEKSIRERGGVEESPERAAWRERIRGGPRT